LAGGLVAAAAQRLRPGRLLVIGLTGVAIVVAAMSLAQSPPAILNVTGPETVAVRDLAGRIGRLLGKTPRFVSQEATTALLSNASTCFEKFGRPEMSLDDMIGVIVPWVAAGKPVLGRLTKYAVRDGRF